jgi:hypothetical protein
MASIALDDALILPYRANPRRMGFSGTTVATIEPDEQGAVDPTQTQLTARRALPQDVELMPQY